MNLRPRANGLLPVLGRVLLLEVPVAVLERRPGHELFVHGADDGAAVVELAPEGALGDLVVEGGPVEFSLR